MQAKLIKSEFAVADSLYSKHAAVINLNSAYKPKAIPLENLVAASPTVNSAEQLLRLFETVSLPVSALLMPQFPGVKVDKLTLKELAGHPAFQLK